MLACLFIALMALSAQLARSEGMPPGCNTTRGQLCIFQYVDTNADGIITAEEIDAFNITDVCGASLYPGGDFLPSSIVFPTCDVTPDGTDAGMDGVITADDFLGPHSCMRSAALRVMICKQCDQCDAYALSLIPTTAPTAAPTEPPTDAPTEAPTVDPFAWMTTDPPTEAPTM